MTHHYTKRAQPSALREHHYGPLQALEDDSVWSCIRSGLIWTNALVWGVAAVIAIIVMGQ